MGIHSLKFLIQKLWVQSEWPQKVAKLTCSSWTASASTTGDEKVELDGPWLDKSEHFSSSSGCGGSVQHASTPAFGIQQRSVVNVYGERKKQEQKILSCLFLGSFQRGEVRVSLGRVLMWTIVSFIFAEDSSVSSSSFLSESVNVLGFTGSF